MVSPVLVDTADMVGQTAALVAESGHIAHLPDSFPTLVERVDILAHTFDRGMMAVGGRALVAACSTGD